jgi:hypothetical protein
MTSEDAAREIVGRISAHAQFCDCICEGGPRDGVGESCVRAAEHAERIIAAALDAARREEREACGNIAKARMQAHPIFGAHTDEWLNACDAIAAAIRARGTTSTTKEAS